MYYIVNINLLDFAGAVQPFSKKMIECYEGLHKVGMKKENLTYLRLPTHYSGGSRGFQGFHGTPFGFSCDKKLWKPGLQQNLTVKTV